MASTLPNGRGGLGAVVDDGGNTPQTQEKQGKEGNSAENGHHGSS
jgi:hypothetical protein